MPLFLTFLEEKKKKLIEIHTDLPYADRRIREEALVQGHALC